jgi:hypothetical protein
MTTFGESLDSKCDAIKVDQLNTTLTQYINQQSEDREKLAVAIHFVEWFASRGELYEQNMRIIDRHLGKLSEASHPQNRPSESGQGQGKSYSLPRIPFENNVRNEPILSSQYKLYQSRLEQVFGDVAENNESSGDDLFMPDIIEDPSYLYLA